jgi:hypothetical protein
MHRRFSIAGLTEAESILNDPWQQLFDLISLVARQLGWHIGDLFQSNR